MSKLLECSFVNMHSSFKSVSKCFPASFVAKVDWVTGSVEVEFVRPQDDFCIGTPATFKMSVTLQRLKCMQHGRARMILQLP